MKPDSVFTTKSIDKMQSTVFSSCKAALTTETKQCKTIPKQIQNNVLFQALLHAEQNIETIPKPFGIVLELFQAH